MPMLIQMIDTLSKMSRADLLLLLVSLIKEMRSRDIDFSNIVAEQLADAGSPAYKKKIGDPDSLDPQIRQLWIDLNSVLLLPGKDGKRRFGFQTASFLEMFAGREFTEINLDELSSVFLGIDKEPRRACIDMKNSVNKKLEKIGSQFRLVSVINQRGTTGKRFDTSYRIACVRDVTTPR